MNDHSKQKSDADQAAGIRARGRQVLETEAAAVQEMAGQLSGSFVAAVDLIAGVKGRVIVSGIGKSGHIARKIAATLASTGTPAFFVHPAEASHGDLGMITADDACLVLSNSGETTELADLVAHTRRFAIPLISICRTGESALARHSDIVLLLPQAPEACSIGMAPTTSTTCSLAIGDALAVTVMELRGFEKSHFLDIHPGGRLGAQMLKVSAIMHTGDSLPVVAEDAAMGEVIVEMTAKSLGMAAVVRDGRLTGAITDGDLRRSLPDILALNAGQVATADPRTIAGDALVSDALRILNEHKINALLVVDGEGRLSGLLHVHDCLRAGVA